MRYANNLLKNPATKRFSGKIDFRIGPLTHILPLALGRGQAAFAEVMDITVELKDASQLYQVASALQLAQGVQNLKVSCRPCSPIRKIPFAQHLRKLFRRGVGLRSLVLEHFFIKSLPEKAFENLPRLEALHLGSNALSVLPAHVFEGLTNLRTLGVSRNRLTSFHKNTFAGLGKLETLELSHPLPI